MEVTPKAAKSHPPESGNSVESTPRENRELKHRQTLSSSLKERLKRSRRSFTSPFSVAKRLCVEDLETDGQHVSADPQETVNNLPVIMHSVDVNRHEGRSGSERLCGSVPEPTHPPKDVIQLRDRLRREVKDKTETVRRLKMVKMYRSKNDLTHLQNLIDKWRRCAQAALYELQSDVPVEGRKASLSEVIDLFGLDDSILHFNRTEEDFTI